MPSSFLRIGASIVRFATLIVGLTFAMSNAVAVEPPNADAKVETNSGISPQSVTFSRRTFTIERDRNKIYIDGSLLTKQNLQDFKQPIQLIEYFDQQDLTTYLDLYEWAKSLKSPRVYTYDVVLQSVNGAQKNLGPLVLLDQSKRAAINPLWQKWAAELLASQEKSRREQEAKELEQAKLQALQSSQEAIAESARVTANALAVLSGETILWEIELAPKGSTPGTGTYFSGTNINIQSSS